MKRLLLGALWVSGLFGCAAKEVNYAVNIVTQNCDPSADPFGGVQFLRIRVTGEGMEPKTETSAANSAAREVKIPEIPSGKGRVIEVRGYENDPNGGGKVISIGKSLPFDVPDVVPEELVGGSLKVNVILRKVNTFSPIVSAAAPTSCQSLRTARAGHVATLLKSGKVFIAGGFNLSRGNNDKVHLADTEIFNPATGAFELAKPLSLTVQGSVYQLPRAYPASVRIPNGQVVIWGGETYTNNVAAPQTTILFYDEDVDDYGAVGPRTPAPIGRSHHKMVVDANGKIFVAGGVTRYPGSNQGIVPVNEVEWLDTATNLYKIVDGVTLPREDPVVMPVKNGEFIAVAGGSDGAMLRSDITFFKFTGTTFAQQSTSMPPRLTDPGRRAAAGALIRDGADLLVIGGYNDAKQVKPIASSEVLTAASATVGAGPDIRTARGDLCAVTMGDGRVLAAGGRTADTGSQPKSSATAVMISASSQGGVTSIAAPDLPKARYGHTCTTLLDGSVLIAGGINELVDGTQEILSDAYIFTPAPLD
jgi:hypothetical protein